MDYGPYAPSQIWSNDQVLADRGACDATMEILTRSVVPFALVACLGFATAQHPPGSAPHPPGSPPAPVPHPPASVPGTPNTGEPAPRQQPSTPPPLPGVPVTPPPVDHPALAGQPLFQPPAPSAAPSGSGAPKAPAPVAKPVDPDTVGPKLAGKDLEGAVAKVAALRWIETLSVAQAAAAATKRPILWLQGLGELDGLACSTLQSLRGITLANDLVLEQLRDRFVLGRSNLERELHVGLSLGYRRDQTAVGTTNGSGGRNVQMVFLAADGTVLHVLPGFWHALDLLPELALVLQLDELHASADYTLAQKRAMAATMHRSLLRRVSGLALDRSHWQDTDAAAEQERGRIVPRDTFVVDAKGLLRRDKNGLAELKPLVVVAHERSLARGFVPLADFSMEEFVDYGVPLFDANVPFDQGTPFPGAVLQNQKRARALAAKAAPTKLP